MTQNVLILERSSENLKKISQKGKTVLEGTFAEFGVENRNGRVYEEKEYLPHLEYLKKDITNGSLLGELDHPERFEVALGNVSHRVSELWYDQSARQIKGRIEILEGTPKGQIAKSLLEAGVPLSISSRAAGTVNEDKTVQIQQIYTYDLVAKPGFESAQLQNVNESSKARVKSLVESLNENYRSHEKDDISKNLGIVNENISIIDVSDKYPSVALREEAKNLLKNVKNKSEKVKMAEENFESKGMNEEAVQQWTLFFKKELSNLNERLDAIEKSVLEEGSNGNASKELAILKKYVNKLRSIQEGSINWQSDIAKSVNKLATYADTLAKKSNKHYGLTKKITETVDHNAKTLNATQDWVGENAKVTNAIGSTVDHNAKMLNEVNNWNREIAKGVNSLHEWGTEKAKAINEMHDWTSSIAKNLNLTANWSEDMFGRAVSKDEAKRLVEYIDLVSESKKDPKLRKKLIESFKNHGISGKSLNESMITPISGTHGLGVISDVKTTGNEKVDVDAGKDSGVEFSDKYKTIISKIRAGKTPSKTTSLPKGLKTLTGDKKSGSVGSGKIKGVMTLDTVKSGSKPTVKVSGDGPSSTMKNAQRLKLDTKPEGKKLNESGFQKSSIKQRASKLDEKLTSIMSTIEKQKKVDEETINQYPFTQLLSETDRKAFAALSKTDKEKVANEVKKNPTTESNVIKKLWENVVTQKTSNEPLWLKAAPKKYKELFEKAPETEKAAIKARAEFYPLETEYQINNFWETTNLRESGVSSLNEVVTAKSTDQADKKMDSFVQEIGNRMRKYNV